MANPTPSVQESLPVDVPPDTLVVEPLDDSVEDTEASKDDTPNVPRAEEDCDEATHVQSDDIEVEIIPECLSGSVEIVEAPSADQSQERGWLHRDMLSKTDEVPLEVNSEGDGDCKGVSVEGENHDRDSEVIPDTSVCPNEPSSKPVDGPVGVDQLPSEVQPDTALVQPCGDQAPSEPPPTISTTTKEPTTTPQHPTKNSSTPSLNRTNNLEAKKNRLLDILNAKTKDLSMTKQKDVIHVPGFVEGDPSPGSVFDLPPNTEVIHPTSTTQTPEPLSEDSCKGSEVTPDDPHLIINKPVTQIMAKSKRKTKKPLPNRSSLESMIDAASDITDFFSIANTLDDSEEDYVPMVVDEVESKDGKTMAESLQIHSTKALSMTKATVINVPTSKGLPVVRVVDAATFGRQSTTQTNPQFATAQITAAVATQPPVNHPQQQPLTQATQLVQQLVQQQQHSQFPILQQKLIQPLQGQILVQGSIMQGSILQPANAAGSVIVQQQSQQQQQFVPIQSIQQTVPMQSIIQQTAVMPSVYQSQIPVVQQQPAQQLPVFSSQQSSGTIFTCSSTTPTLIKPQQTVFVLQRGDALKLDSLGNLIVIGKEDCISGQQQQQPVIQPGSSILPVNSVKNLLNIRNSTSVPQEPAVQAGAAVVTYVNNPIVESNSSQLQISALQMPSTSVPSASVSTFNRPVILGKQPIASVQPQRQRTTCPNPELDLIRTASLSPISGTPTPSVAVSNDPKPSTVTTTGSDIKGIKIFQCEKCKKLFVSKASLFNHLATEMHTKGVPEHVRLPYKCSICTAQFAFKASLVFHTNRSCCTNEIPTFNVICSICKLRFKNLVDLERHIVRCHHLLPGHIAELHENVSAKKADIQYKKIAMLEKTQSVAKTVPTPKEATPKWAVINSTPKVQDGSEDRPPIKLVVNVKRKKKSKHRGKKRTRSSPEHPCRAEVLKDEDATTRNLINTHGRYLNKAVRPFSCKICAKAFTSEHCLLEHIKTHIKPFSCSACGWKSPRKDNVLKHIQQHHNGPKYERKRQSKTKHRSPSPSSSDSDGNEEETVEEVVKHIKTEKSDHDEDPDLDLDDEDDKPNDYFGSGRFPPDDDDDDDNDHDNSGNSDRQNNPDKSPEKGTDSLGDQEMDEIEESTQPASGDHNYSSHTQSAEDSTQAIEINIDKLQAQSEINDDANTQGHIIPSPCITQPAQSQVRDPSEIGPNDSSSISKEDGLSQGLNTTQEKAEENPPKDMETTTTMEESCSSSYPSGTQEAVGSFNQDSITSNEDAQDQTNSGNQCEEELSSDQKNISKDVSIVASLEAGCVDIPMALPNQDNSIPASQPTHSSDCSGRDEQNVKQDRLVPENVPTHDEFSQDVCTTPMETIPYNTQPGEDNQEIRSSSPFAKHQSLLNGDTQSPRSVSEQLPNILEPSVQPLVSSAKSATSDPKSTESLIDSDTYSENDILEWSSSDFESEDEEGVERIQTRPILLRDEDANPAAGTGGVDETLIIDDDNLEIRPKHSVLTILKADTEKGDIERVDEEDIDDAPEQQNSYYTVLNAEGGDVNVEDGASRAPFDGAVEVELSVLDHTDNIFLSSQEADGEEAENEEDCQLTEVIQAQAKCSINPETRVKMEFCGDGESNAVMETSNIQQILPQCQEICGTYQSDPSKALENRLSTDQVQVNSREIFSVERFIQNKQDIPGEKNTTLVISESGAVKIKQEPFEVCEIETEMDDKQMTAEDSSTDHSKNLGPTTTAMTQNRLVSSSPPLQSISRPRPFPPPTSDPLSSREATSSPNSQVLPVIASVGSLSDQVEMNQKRKSVILEALNRPGQPYPPPPYDSRLMYNSMGVPIVDPSTGQPFIPRYPNPSNPYISMFHSGSIMDPRGPFYPGHPGMSPPSAVMGYRPPHMSSSLPEGRFPGPSGFPPMMGQAGFNRGGYLPKHDQQAHFDQHHKKAQLEKHEHEHLQRQMQRDQQKYQRQQLERQWQERQHGLKSISPSHASSHQPGFSSTNPGAGQTDRFIFPKHPYEDRVGSNQVINPLNIEPSDSLVHPCNQFKANTARLPQHLNPSDPQIVPRIREFGEIAKPPPHLEQNGNSMVPSLPTGPHFPPGSHLPLRPSTSLEATTPSRFPEPSRPGLPGPNRVPVHVDEQMPNHGLRLPRQMSQEMLNDQPPPLVYQGHQQPQDLTVIKPGDQASEIVTVEESSEKQNVQLVVKREKSIDDDKASDLQEVVSQYVSQNSSILQDVSSQGESIPPPPPLPPSLPSTHIDHSRRPHYVLPTKGEILETLITRSPLAHEPHPEYVPVVNGTFASPPIHVGPPQVSPNLPSPRSVPRSPKKRHSSCGSTEHESHRRRKRSPRTDENPEERPYACHICGNRFKRSNNLTDHVRIHSRPYKCGECSFDTTRWQYLADHLKKNHNFEGDAKELEMMFKSGKRLKPTDHIPETCYQPAETPSSAEKHSPHPVRNGFSPASRSMVVPPSNVIIPRGTDIVHRDRSRKRKRRHDYDDEDLVDFFGNTSGQDDSDETVAPITIAEEKVIEIFDDVAPGCENGAQISPGNSQAQTSPKESPNPEVTWSKRKQLTPVKVAEEEIIEEGVTPEFSTSLKTVESCHESTQGNDSVEIGKERRIKKEVNETEEYTVEHITEENGIDLEEQADKMDEEMDYDSEEDEDEDEDESDNGAIDDLNEGDYPQYPSNSDANHDPDESDDAILYTPTGRPKRKTGNYTFQSGRRRHCENEDPEYNPMRRQRKKRGIVLKIHIKRGKRRGRPRNKPPPSSTASHVEALSTHIGGGLDLSPYYNIVEDSDGDMDRRPYQCMIDDCNKRFKSKQHMREHLFTHLKPYKCDGCALGFARTDYLAMHMREMHKMSPTRADLFNKRKSANGRAMACRMRPSKDKRRQELQQSFKNGNIPKEF